MLYENVVFDGSSFGFCLVEKEVFDLLEFDVCGEVLVEIFVCFQVLLIEYDVFWIGECCVDFVDWFCRGFGVECVLFDEDDVFYFCFGEMECDVGFDDFVVDDYDVCVIWDWYFELCDEVYDFVNLVGFYVFFV